jgi:hypothetical protein
VEESRKCIRCARDVGPCRDEPGDVVCAGCLTLSEDIAETTAFVALCYDEARVAPTPQCTRRAYRYAELALTNLARRHGLFWDAVRRTAGR